MSIFQDLENLEKQDYLNRIPKERLEILSEKITNALVQAETLDHFDIDNVIAPFKDHDLDQLNYANIEISQEMRKRNFMRNRDSRRLLAMVSRLLDLAIANSKKDF